MTFKDCLECSMYIIALLIYAMRNFMDVVKKLFSFFDLLMLWHAGSRWKAVQSGKKSSGSGNCCWKIFLVVNHISIYAYCMQPFYSEKCAVIFAIYYCYRPHERYNVFL